MSSDSKRIEIFNSNFTLNINHQKLIAEEINFKPKNFFEPVEPIDLLHDFMIYLISNEKHFFINEIIRKKIQINGEEKYLILRLEDVKYQMDMIYAEKMKEYQNEQDKSVELVGELQKFLFKMIQIYETLIRNTIAILNFHIFVNN